jgi:RimJ/RimL family protein N-acetyltransferase
VIAMSVDGVPVLETERLRLRGPAASDLDAEAAMWADSAVVRHIGNPSTREESWARILRSRGLWALLGYGYWVVEEKASGRFVGDVGLADFNRLLEPSISGIPEIGWVLDSRCHGLGYASEAAAAALGWGEANLSADRYCCIISPGNVASIRVAEKLGFKLTAETTYKNDPILVFHRPASRRTPVASGS